MKKIAGILNSEDEEKYNERRLSGQQF